MTGAGDAGRRPFTGSERDGFYAFLRDSCRTEHYGQDEIGACEAATYAAWRDLPEPERQVYRDPFEHADRWPE